MILLAVLIKGYPLVLSGSIMMDIYGLDRPLLIGGRPDVVALGRTYGGALALVQVISLTYTRNGVFERKRYFGYLLRDTNDEDRPRRASRRINILLEVLKRPKSKS
jgi:hypothetical protein